MEQIIEIIDEGKGWIAVGKPAGLSVHNYEDGVNLLSILQDQLGYPLHAVHRLDSPTSGVMILAKSPHHTQIIQQALTQATKEYTAILRGVVTPTEGSWNWRITNKGEGFRNPRGRKSDQVAAKTSFKTIRSNQYLTLAKLTLETGRQHQIRKHAAVANHAVIGDLRYGDRRYNSKITQRFGIDQLCLCASKLELVLDSKNRCFEVNVPNIWTTLI